MTLSLSRDGRKYTLILFFGLVASAALFVGRASFTEWTYFMLPWGGFYLAANVVQKYKGGETSLEPRASKS